MLISSPLSLTGTNYLVILVQMKYFPCGPFRRCCLALPHLGIRVRLEPLDICLIQGAALWHHMYTWEGQGCFVVVPFAYRHLFPFSRVKWPTNPLPSLGDF